MIEIVGLGAGGHSRVLIDALRVTGVKVSALTDSDPELLHTFVEDVEVVGDDSSWEDLLAKGVRRAFVGIGGAGSTRVRRSLFERALEAGFEIITVIHPSAVVAASAVLGKGVQVLANAVVNAGAIVQDNVIVNTAAVVEHDCIIESHSHLATGARLAGSVRVGRGSHVGIGAAVRQGIMIGEESVIGAGAVVVRDVRPGTTVVGVPATELVRRDQTAESLKT